MGELSPMMRQYLEIKEQNSDSIVFFRLGDFYEMFFEDAKTASNELELYLTGRDCGLEERAPMCGVPYHSCEAYIARLVEKGYKVAICEQTEDPSKAKGIVKREVVRIITPGTVVEESMLKENENNYLAAVAKRENAFGLSFTDASTGKALVTEISGEDSEKRAFDEIMRFSPSELLISEDLSALPRFSALLKGFEGAVTQKEKAYFDAERSVNTLNNHFSVMSAEALGIPKNSAAVLALGAVISYLYETGMRDKIAVNEVQFYTEDRFMRLDNTAIRNLEIMETMRQKTKKGSLLWVVDKTKTAMGKRLMKSWVGSPLKSIPEINLRQNATEELLSNSLMRLESEEYLSGIRDIERMASKAIYGNATARDLLTIASSTEKLPFVKGLLVNATSNMLKGIFSDIDPLDDITSLINSSINPEPPQTLKEGDIIKSGYSAEVDALRRDMNSGTDFIAEIEAREKERTGIKNLRVRYNKVFGYYIEVTNSFLDRVPEDYIRKQTLTNCERFITEELKSLETRVLTAKDRLYALEYELFDGIRKQVAAEIVRLQKTAEAVAKLDCLCSFAKVASENNYTRPLVNFSGSINIKSGRHPVIEQLIKTPFVVNDTFLDKENNRCAIITGPNMAGKSTYMRQTAIIVIMAQMGSFVPAEMAEIGIVDAVFTRVGASDDLASGKSTFMVEMSEVADILKYATENSLLILDEIGRGTSTFDGMSIARAVLEFCADKKKLGAKTLFATHYHELTEMENELLGVKNYNIAVKKRGDDIIFLRRIVAGGADQSYGIEVAKLGGIPESVIKRAKQILKETELSGVVTYKTSAAAPDQLSFEMQGSAEILRELQSIDVNTLTPIEAMSALFDIVNKAKSI